MAFVPVPDTVLVELRFDYFGQKIENTLYFRKLGGSSTAQATGLMNDLEVWWTSLLSTYLSEDISLRELNVTDLSSVSGYSVSQSTPTPHPTGQIVAAGMPGSVALCVSLRTPNRGRSYRGRNYVCGLAETNVIGNTVDSSIVAGVLGSYQGIPSSIVSSAWDWVVVSRFNGGAPRVTGVATDITSVVIVDDFVDSQRRRLTGRGT
jgi:hypothetical protein